MSYIPRPATATRTRHDRSEHRRSTIVVNTPAKDAFLEAGTVLQDAGQLPPRSRTFELPNLSLSWPHAATTRRSTATGPSLMSEPRLWTAEETSFLAQASLEFWMGGRTADLDRVARHLRRTTKDVRTMLQLMLQEHVLQAHKTHWSDREDSDIRRWAAAEFPKCSILSIACTSRRRPSILHEAKCCFSLRRRRPLPGAAIPAAAETFAPPAPLPDTLPVLLPAAKQEPNAETKRPGVAAGLHPIAGPPSRQDEILDANNTEPSLPHPEPNVDALTKPRSGAKVNFSFPLVTIAPAPLDSAAPTASAQRKSVNVLTRTSRSRRLRDLRARRAAVPVADSPSTTPTYPTKQALEQTSKALCMLYDTADCVVTDLTSTQSGRAVDVELSPEQSTNTHDFNRYDGDIDLHFFDVPAASRRVIREFVERYIMRFFEVFFYRISNRTDAGLCAALNTSDSASALLVNLELMFTIERAMLAFDAMQTNSSIDLNRCSAHFHMCTLRAVQPCNIYVTDSNWPSAAAYATAVYNRIIEDVHYLAFESRLSVDSMRSHRGEDVAARMNRFKRTHYMGIIATRLALKFVQGPGRQVFLARAQRLGYRAVPAAAGYDDNLSEDELAAALDEPASDVAVRAELHSLIMDMVPHATNESTMIAMQRSIEVYNKALIDHVEAQRGELATAFALTAAATAKRTASAPPLRVGAVTTVETACTVGQWLADQCFDSLKDELLRLLMMDHQFSPVALIDVRRWIAEDRSPAGKSLEFIVNTKLYSHLKARRVLMSELKWLYASAAATLRLVELAKQHVRRTHLLEHVSVSAYAAQFRESIAAAAAPSPRTMRIQPTSLAMPQEKDDGMLPLLLQVSPAEVSSTTAPTPLEMLSGDESDWGLPANNFEHELEESRLRIEKLAHGAVAKSALPSKPVAANNRYKPLADAPQGLRFGNHEYASATISPLTDASAFLGVSDAAPASALLPITVAEQVSQTTRLDGLEKDVARMRQGLADMAGLRRDLDEIISLLRGQQTARS